MAQVIKGHIIEFRFDTSPAKPNQYFARITLAGPVTAEQISWLKILFMEKAEAGMQIEGSSEWDAFLERARSETWIVK